jgi:hypothetical protein
VALRVTFKLAFSGDVELEARLQIACDHGQVELEPPPSSFASLSILLHLCSALHITFISTTRRQDGSTLARELGETGYGESAIDERRLG